MLRGSRPVYESFRVFGHETRVFVLQFVAILSLIVCVVVSTRNAQQPTPSVTVQLCMFSMLLMIVGALLGSVQENCLADTNALNEYQRIGDDEETEAGRMQ